MPQSYNHDFTLSLAASSTLGIAATQTASAGALLTINGGLATGGVATLDVPRRVIVTSAGNDSADTFTVTGTDYFGRLQTELLTGASGTAAMTFHDFKTVTSILTSTATSGNVSAGTNGVGSSIPWVIDEWANPSVFGVGTVVTGTANYNVEKSYDNLFPAWNVNTNTPTWYADANFNAITSNTNNQIQGPLTMLRLTINSGTGSVTARARQSYIGRS